MIIWSYSGHSSCNIHEWLKDASCSFINVNVFGDGFKFPLVESHQEIPYISPPIS